MFPPHENALICGVSGQEVAYLAKMLLEKGYHVFGTSRDAQVASFANLDWAFDHRSHRAGVMVLTDFRSKLQTTAKAKLDEVYNLAGQSSVALSFQQPVEAMHSISVGTLNLLEAVRFLGSEIRIYNASECVGDTKAEAASERAPFRPRSPYADAQRLDQQGLRQDGRHWHGLALLELISYLEEDLGVTIPLKESDWRPGDQPALICNLN